jgi:predicted DCC family thiol-disulfide oxidoreductase YuxK
MSDIEKSPLLIYDGDCEACTIWVEHWARLTGETVDYQPYQLVAPEFPDFDTADFQYTILYVTPDGEIYRNAEAVFELLNDVPRRGWLQPFYYRLPGFRNVSEAFFRFLLNHPRFSRRATKFLWGNDVGPHMFILTRWLFLRLLGIVYLMAFGALSYQIIGLVGSNGILPAESYLERVAQSPGIEGLERYIFAPTLAWIDVSDAFLMYLCYAGMILSLLLILNILPAPVLVASWVCYLSLMTVGQTFLSFQWDSLLLEVGFLAIFLGPLPLRRFRLVDPPIVVVWLFRWLAFRLMFSSGMVKLNSNDPVWLDLSALEYHYWTQPIPTPLAWFVHQLPDWFHRVSTFGMFMIEMVVPFLFFLPRRPRLIGALLTILFQVLILLTGNYTFFNWLTIALCIMLLDDSYLRRFFPRWMVVLHVRRPRPSLLRRIPLAIFTLLIVFLSSLTFTSRLVGRYLPDDLPAPATRFVRYAYALRITNSYGLFANMTTTRPEILVEGSRDGETWETYEFYYKPGDITRSPPAVAPYHPRLDWQMWFAALGTYERNPWFVRFMEKLLEGSPEVLALIEHNPFPDEPPQFIRARMLDYTFSDAEAREVIGAWWVRRNEREYFPAVSLEAFE